MSRHRAIDGAMVAFEVDDVDAVRHSGLGVVVTGTATVVIDPPRTNVWPAPFWPPGCSQPQEAFARVEPRPATGRELGGGGTLYGVDPTV
ncbi:hypothetical protein GCM10017744_080020 [Streptomyces antimycoticus]|uniref:Uncharacterized protein n=1 Tax=Streptomyces antimycoticus TaxID=68175 RepID=A0A4D4K4J7_9ACTN|nr:hypothetical protein [Streptomyces antimycoticus]GDY41249.1 hypothetical protein SANT12839_021310 [Streptomyces antimycoticus]